MNVREGLQMKTFACISPKIPTADVKRAPFQQKPHSSAGSSRELEVRSEVGEGSFPASAWLPNLSSLSLWTQRPSFAPRTAGGAGDTLRVMWKAGTAKEPICVLPNLLLTPAPSFWFHWQPQHPILEMVFSTLAPSCTWGMFLMSCSVKEIIATTFYRTPASLDCQFSLSTWNHSLSYSGQVSPAPMTKTGCFSGGEP